MWLFAITDSFPDKTLKLKSSQYPSQKKTEWKDVWKWWAKNEIGQPLLLLWKSLLYSTSSSVSLSVANITNRQTTRRSEEMRLGDRKGGNGGRRQRGGRERSGGREKATNRHERDYMKQVLSKRQFSTPPPPPSISSKATFDEEIDHITRSSGSLVCVCVLWVERRSVGRSKKRQIKIKFESVLIRIPKPFHTHWMICLDLS